ncbi:hypothetical protein GCK72_022907 [Caenorhabditis remanei]|uniref:Uncharacterized protein n=1 Tax=Caenorhabditis remanei TaxID=31234 RepID=A0A6A5FVK8_CAERE|nr:hypothetical protein GCK72_022907 [Caenorhabditis remanei]KAF1746451.1 hypothetical protein GCK72_022907 [Caenorhabditis remanei]
MNSKTKRHDLTVWNMVQVPVMGIRKDPKAPQSLTHWVASYPRTMLFPSTYALPNYLHKHYKIHHYLLDDDDMLAIKHITADTPGFKWTKESVTGFASLENFMRLVLTIPGNYQQKKLYMRMIPALAMGETRNRVARVFADEVALMIPLLKEQQGEPLEDPKGEQEKLFKMLNHLEKAYRSTITLERLHELLCEYDIDKSLLTLVDDPVHIIGCKSFAQTGVHFKILNTVGTKMISREQAVLYMYETLICGVNWTGIDKEKKRNCYILYIPLLRVILDLKKKNPEIYNTGDQWMDFLYLNKCPNDFVSPDDFKEITDDFDIDYFDNPFIRENLLPVWLVRAMLVLGWMNGIVRDESDLLKFVSNIIFVLVDALMPSVPPQDRQRIIDTGNAALELWLASTDSSESENEERAKEVLDANQPSTSQPQEHSSQGKEIPANIKHDEDKKNPVSKDSR